MKKGVILLVAAVALVVLSLAVVSVAKHTVTNTAKVDSVATMTYGLEGGAYNILSFHERHRAMNARPVDRNAMRLRPVQKLQK